MVIIFFGDRYFDFFGVSGNILIYAKEYFTFYKYVYVLTPLVNFIVQMVYCDGGVKVNTAGIAVYFVLDVVLSIVFGMAMGMAGIALGITELFSCISRAMLPIANIYHGEKNRDGVRKIFKVTFRTMTVMGIMLTILMFAMAPVFPWIYSITTPELSAAAVSSIRIISLSFLFVAIMTVLPAYYNSRGKIWMATIVSRVKDSFFYILFSVLFGSLFGLTGLCVGIMLSPVAAAVLMFLILWFTYDRENMLLLPTDDRIVESWDLLLSEEGVDKLRNQVEGFLLQNGVPKKTALTASFVILILLLSLPLMKTGWPGAWMR